MAPFYVGKGGVERVKDYDIAADKIDNMTSRAARSLFSESYRAQFTSAMENSNKLAFIMETSTLNTTFKKGKLSSQFENIALVLKGKETLDSERMVFGTSLGSWDAHADNDSRDWFNSYCEELDGAIGELSAEVKKQGLWDNVTIVVANEMARTLDSNGLGTDHGWGGWDIVIGGAVRGGIQGNYPTAFRNHPYMWQRGIMVPELPREAYWKPIAEWFGVNDSAIEYVLPNVFNFDPKRHLVDVHSLFETF